MDRTPDDFQFITADDLARKLGVTRATVYRQVALGVLPRPYYIASRAARWRVDEVLQALEARRLAPREALERGIRPKAAPEVRRWRPSSNPAAEA
jgi:predicted DNA-binding transcriptional regulator AlpA